MGPQFLSVLISIVTLSLCLMRGGGEWVSLLSNPLSLEFDRKYFSLLFPAMVRRFHGILVFSGTHIKLSEVNNFVTVTTLIKRTSFQCLFSSFVQQRKNTQGKKHKQGFLFLFYISLIFLYFAYFGTQIARADLVPFLGPWQLPSSAAHGPLLGLTPFTPLPPSLQATSQHCLVP